MQIWIFFPAGAGGDAFANLLEHAQGVRPIDDIRMWRIHRYVDGEPKFWMPSPDTGLCFRSGMRFDSSKNELHPNYRKAIDECAIVASHDTSLKSFYSSDCLDIFTRDQVKVLIKPRNIMVSNLKFAKKNLQELSLSQVALLNSDFDETSEFDHKIFLDEVLSDWATIKNFLSSIGITITKEIFEHFKQICQGDIVYVTPGIRHYTSSIIDDQLHYKDITDFLQIEQHRKRTHVWPVQD